MKVAVLTNYWKESDGGGIKSYLIGLVNELKRRNLQVTVVFREGSDPQNIQLKTNKFTFPLKALIKLIKIKPDVIHTHGDWYCLFPGVLLKKIYGTRLIHTFHTEPSKDKELSLFGKAYLQWLIKNCNCVTFVSKGLEKKINEQWGLIFNNTEITYAGVKAKRIAEGAKKDFCKKFLIENRWPILLLQAFTSNKLKAEGAQLAMLVCKVLKERYPQVVLLVTRKGIYQNDLQKFAEMEGVIDNVVFTGDLEDAFVPLDICDIFLHPWLGGGGVSIVLLEAMSMGKPIVATYVGGVPEAIRNMENRILVEPDVKKISEKIEYLIELPDIAQKIGNNARETVENEFTWIIAVNKFIQCYGATN